MIFWKFIANIFLTLGLNTGQIFDVVNIKLIDNNFGQRAIVEQSVLPAANFILPKKINNQSFGVKISAVSAAVMDKASGAVLWQKSADQIRPIASITKLMTALVFLEHNPGWEKEITMEERDEASQDSPDIKRGESVKVRDLFFTALVSSDNNATKALVRSTGLAEEAFVKLMNNKAAALGLTKTSFVEVTGLNQDDQSTALDLLKLANNAFANPYIRQATSSKVYNFTALSGQEHKIKSTDNLLGSYLDIRSGKTGYTSQSGYCFVVEVAGSAGQNILTVVLGSATNAERFQEAKILSGWIWQNFSWS